VYGIGATKILLYTEPEYESTNVINLHKGMINYRLRISTVQSRPTSNVCSKSLTCSCRNILTLVLFSCFSLPVTVRRLRLKCDGTRAEKRFRLSAKWTSPFKSAGASVQSTTGSRGVCISGSNGRGQLKCDGTSAETRFGLSAKRTLPIKSAGASVQSATGSRCVRISGSNVRGQLKCDGTSAETRFRLSAKRTNPFKSGGGSVQSTTGSLGVRISGSNGTVQLKCDGTSAETRFRLSAKRTFPFKSEGGVSSVFYWQPRCAHQR